MPYSILFLGWGPDPTGWTGPPPPQRRPQGNLYKGQIEASPDRLVGLTVKHAFTIALTYYPPWP